MRFFITSFIRAYFGPKVFNPGGKFVCVKFWVFLVVLQDYQSGSGFENVIYETVLCSRYFDVKKWFNVFR